MGPQTPVVAIVNKEGEVGDKSDNNKSLGVGGTLLLGSFPPGRGERSGFDGVAFGEDVGDRGEEEETELAVAEDMRQGRTG
jgi:hypothetical protein